MPKQQTTNNKQQLFKFSNNINYTAEEELKLFFTELHSITVFSEFNES